MAITIVPKKVDESTLSEEELKQFKRMMKGKAYSSPVTTRFLYGNPGTEAREKRAKTHSNKRKN